MSNRIRLFAAAGLFGCLAGGPARADGKIEKPPGVPPEVEAAKTACPTLHGPCYGFYPTRWRVMSGCCVPPAAAAVLPPGGRMEIPPAATEPPVARPRAAKDKAPAKPESKPKLEPAAARVVVTPPALRPLEVPARPI